MNYTTDLPLMGQVKTCTRCMGGGTINDYTQTPVVTLLCPLCQGYGNMIVVGVDRDNKGKIASLPAVLGNPPKPPPPPPEPPKKIILV